MNKNTIKRAVVGIVAVLVLSVLFGRGGSNNTKTSTFSSDVTVEDFEIERDRVNFSEKTEAEIFYRFLEVRKEIGSDPLPKIGQKNQHTPKKDKAIRAVADEYNISTKQTREVIEKVQNRQPTDEEFEIFKTYDKQLDEAIDLEAAGKKLMDEDKITQEVADSFDISPDKLSDIWLRVFVWKEENEIEADHRDVLAENTKSVKENEKQEASQNNINPKISKGLFDIYYKAFLKLSELQKEKEEEYEKFEKNGLYGPINREIISIRDSLPKPDFNLPPEERDLLIDIKLYNMNLYFLNPKEDGLEGIGVATDRRKIIEDALDKIKTANGF